MFHLKLILQPVKLKFICTRFLPRQATKSPETNLTNFSPRESSTLKYPSKSINSFENETSHQFNDDETEFYEKDNEPPPDYGRPRGLTLNEERQHTRLHFLKYEEIPVEDETLLTWSAMDQIRQLHENDPKIWTPAEIANSFPISEEGARRFLKTKKPTTFTSETIRKHDQMVESRWRAIRKGIPGVVSEKTLFMIEQGFIKFIPMKSFSDEKLIGNSLKEKIQIELNSDEIQPFDGPFTKLYKRHLQWKNSENNLAKFENSTENDLKMHVSGQQLLKSVVFSKENEQNFDKSNSMMFEDFQQLWKNRIESSKNPVDRKYTNWMNRKSKR